mgnify:CR=1 FL=1
MMIKTLSTVHVFGRAQKSKDGYHRSAMCMKQIDSYMLGIFFNRHDTKISIRSGV